MKWTSAHLDGIKERLQQARKRLSFTQKQMADAMGMSLNTYIRSEAGERWIDLSEVAKLSELGINPNWLLNGNETPGRRLLPTDGELMARIMDGLVMLYREENQRLVPLDQGRMAAEIYDSLIGIEGEAERRGGLRVLLEQRRLEMRRPTPDTTSGKRSA